MDVEGQISETRVLSKGCKNWYCERCCIKKGKCLKHSLQSVLETFTSIRMWTLTFDQALFLTPEHCLRYVRKSRCISRWVQNLRREGWATSARYFYVVEYHEKGWPHFHVLIEAPFIPHTKTNDVAHECWNRSVPVEKRREFGEAGLGWIYVSRGEGVKNGEFQSAAHAANYACKYLTKAPKSEFPAWVKAFKGRIHRTGHNRYFFPPTAWKRPKQGRWATPDKLPDGTMSLPQYLGPKLHEGAKAHEGDCFCSVCRGDETDGEAKRKKLYQERSTIGERLAQCGKKAAVFEVVTKIGGVRFNHLGDCNVPFSVVRAALAPECEGQTFRVPWEVGHQLAMRGSEQQQTFLDRKEGPAWEAWFQSDGLLSWEEYLDCRRSAALVKVVGLVEQAA